MTSEPIDLEAALRFAESERDEAQGCMRDVFEELKVITAERNVAHDRVRADAHTIDKLQQDGQRKDKQIEVLTAALADVTEGTA